jgi:hypothetical protein
MESLAAQLIGFRCTSKKAPSKKIAANTAASRASRSVKKVAAAATVDIAYLGNKPGCDRKDSYAHLPSRFYGALMPADLNTLPHFAVSSTMNLPNSPGVIGVGTLPR